MAPGVRVAVCGSPALVALALGLWQISARSFSQDEAATLSATGRPLTEMLEMLRHIDAVHGVYYLLIYAVRHAGTSALAVRLPSAVATAVAAAVLAALAARLAGPRAGVAAGLLYAVSPPAAEYAQTARPFALATALAVIACYRFAVFAGTGSRRDGAWYAVALAAAGWVNVLTLLIAAANAVTLWTVPHWRQRFRGFVAAVTAAAVLASPLLYLGLSQVRQVAWERPPGPLAWLAVTSVSAGAAALVARLATASRPGPAPGGAVAGAGIPDPPGGAGAPGRPPGAAVPAAPGGALPSQDAGLLAALAAPWLGLPPLTLAATSQVTPLWEPRYLLFCLPAVALLAVAALARLPGRAAAAALAVMTAGILAAQPLARPAVAADDLRAVSRLLGARARPGDAVLFPAIGRRLIEDAYPAGFAHVRDIGLDTAPGHRDTLYGLNVSQAVLDRRLAGVRRVWVVRYAVAHPPRYYATIGHPHAFCAERTWQVPGSTVTLYTRCLLSAAGWSRAPRSGPRSPASRSR